MQNEKTREFIDSKEWTMKYGDQAQFAMGGFSFTVNTSPLDGVPTSMSIENQAYKQKTFYEESYLRPMFSAMKCATLKLTSNQEQQVTGSFRCATVEKPWAVDTCQRIFPSGIA